MCSTSKTHPLISVTLVSEVQAHRAFVALNSVAHNHQHDTREGQTHGDPRCGDSGPKFMHRMIFGIL